MSPFAYLALAFSYGFLAIGRILVKKNKHNESDKGIKNISNKINEAPQSKNMNIEKYNKEVKQGILDNILTSIKNTKDALEVTEISLKLTKENKLVGGYTHNPLKSDKETLENNLQNWLNLLTFDVKNNEATQLTLEWQAYLAEPNKSNEYSLKGKFRFEYGVLIPGFELKSLDPNMQKLIENVTF